MTEKIFYFTEHSMDELKLGPHSERHSSHNVIREQGASEFFTFTEIKVNLLHGETGTSTEMYHFSVYYQFLYNFSLFFLHGGT
jgi:hypothetical protein